jgi:hypothetical protein
MLSGKQAVKDQTSGGRHDVAKGRRQNLIELRFLLSQNLGMHTNSLTYMMNVKK